MKDGKAYTNVEQDASGHTDLYLVDAATGARQLLVHGADLVPPGSRRPVDIEEYRFSDEGANLLVFTKSLRVWRQNTKVTFSVGHLTARRMLPVVASPGYP